MCRLSHIPDQGGAVTTTTTTTPKPKTARQAAVEVLRIAGEPLKSAEIARRVLEVEGRAARGEDAGGDGRGDARGREQEARRAVRAGRARDVRAARAGASRDRQ